MSAPIKTRHASDQENLTTTPDAYVFEDVSLERSLGNDKWPVISQVQKCVRSGLAQPGEVALRSMVRVKPTDHMNRSKPAGPFLMART